MSQQHNAITIQEEGRVDLALQAYTLGQFKSLRCAAAAFNVKHQRLSDQFHGITQRAQTQPNCQKLTATEQQTIVRYILNLNSRGFAPRLYEVADIADKMLAVRGGKPISKCWADRFITRSPKLKMAFNRAKDRQRLLQEDLAVISA
jgi:hypothetical protein